MNQEIERRRTFAIIAHPDAGKTSLTEKLLLFGGQTKSRKQLHPTGWTSKSSVVFPLPHP